MQQRFDFSGLVCAFGEPFLGPHPLCDAETERGCRLFDEAVASGEYDAQGYTPKERKSQAKRKARGHVRAA